ncbi:2-oxoglutarate-dependent dioxygenase 19-like isoform X2 [Diospyros lotus]|uniref:2-oxoglutarate-dependent dioxygenase 19-like isoform X2 n=1 Tax=Diospyros lotus TaxID=55363 RepID=UPI00224DFE6D|nr:2-oxoglutarate-dependent dioxygenase 19-like isoform X2 [Diospyros lotus]
MASISAQTSPEPPKVTTIKALTDSSAAALKSIPPHYNYTTNPCENIGAATPSPDPQDTVPVIDFSLLTSADSEQHSIVIQDLARACQEWGFFLVVNHSVAESLMKAVVDGLEEFFNLREDEKQEFEGKHVLDPIRCGTSFNPKMEKVFLWRDFLKVFVHPHFHFPNKPPALSEVAREYCKRSREVARELLRGISESLGLEPCYIDKAMDLESSLQVFIGNLYPPCPQPELAMGLPPHSDHGLLTLIIQNDTPTGGLQLKHKGKWVNANAPPNCFLVLTGDHFEILSNGKYRSVLHRAVVNSQATRISVALSHGPSLDTVVGPAPELMDGNGKDNQPAAAYIPMRYKEYLELQQSNQLDGKSCLDRVRIQIS